MVLDVAAATLTRKPGSVDRLVRLAEADMKGVNALITDRMQSDVPIIPALAEHLIAAGGKRLRPLLTVAAARLAQSDNDHCLKLAAAVEFIHTATLLHDDVVDISSLRRGRPTANAAFGNAPSVLVGDFLYTRAFQLMVQLDNLAVLRHMADTTNIIAEGEVLQLVRAGNTDITEQQYMDVITRKTAILFAAGCHGAAALAGCDEPGCQRLHDFGLNLGIAFQMIDDVLDYDGDPQATGKNVGDDLTEGKATLPLIHTLREGDADARALVRHAISAKSAGELDAVLAAVQRCGSLDYTRQRARHYHDLALDALAELPAGPARAALEQLTALSLERDH